MGRPPTISREQLLERARYVFTAKGFAAATLADIAGELGVTPAAILRHVASKHALFAEAMQGGDVIEPPAAVMKLLTIDPSTDPRLVLRSVAEEFVPFFSGVLTTRIAIAMHENASRTSLVLPFNAEAADSPPRRGFRIVSEYFRRAAAAGVLRVTDARAAALLFIGSLQGYVLYHAVLHMEPYPLSDYIDALVDLWTEGVIVKKPGGTRVKAKVAAKKNHPDRAARRRDRGDAAVHAAETKASPARAVRNARGADSERGLARRRTGHSRLRR